MVQGGAALQILLGAEQRAIASEFGISLTREFRAWVVLSELRQFGFKKDILSDLSLPPLRPVCPSCPPWRLATGASSPASSSQTAVTCAPATAYPRSLFSGAGKEGGRLGATPRWKAGSRDLVFFAPRPSGDGSKSTGPAPLRGMICQREGRDRD
jgi:hypothetical protein